MLYRSRLADDLLFALAALLFFAATSHAQTLPYSFDVDAFSVPERGIFDDFDDGVLSPSWNGNNLGTSVESGGTLTLSNPGAFGFLPTPIVNEFSIIDGQGISIDLSGDFTATSVWLPSVPAFSQSMNMTLGSLDFVTGLVHQLTVGVSDRPSGVASVLGGDAGLTVDVLDVVRDAGGNIVSLSRSSLPISAAAITDDILLQLVFDDAADTLTPQVSLDGGATTLSPFTSVPWQFQFGGFALAATSTVIPEPGTALLLSTGLLLTAGASHRSYRSLERRTG